MHKDMALHLKQQLEDVGITNKHMAKIKIVQKNLNEKLQIGGMNIKIYMIM